MATQKKTKKGARSPSKRTKAPKVTRRFLDALTGNKQDTYYRVLDALAVSRRHNLTPTKAAKATGTTLKTIRKYAPSALEERSGRVYVKASDHLPRRMRMLTPQGEEVVRTTSSRTASVLAEYNNALKNYVLTRDTDDLQRFANKTVRSGGTTYTFATDSRMLDRFIRAGAVHFVDIYARGAAI